MSSLRRAGRRTLKSPAAAARRGVSSRARAGSSCPPRPFRAVPLAALAVVPLLALPAIPLAVLPAVPLVGFRAELDFSESPCRTAAVFAMPAPPMSFQSELPPARRRAWIARNGLRGYRCMAAGSTVPGRFSWGLPAAAPVGIRGATLGGLQARVLALVEPPLDQREDDDDRREEDDREEHRVRDVHVTRLAEPALTGVSGRERRWCERQQCDANRYQRGDDTGSTHRA